MVSPYDDDAIAITSGNDNELLLIKVEHVIRSVESSGKGMTETLRGVYSLTETIGNGKTMLTFRSLETLRRPLASETVSDWII